MKIGIVTQPLLGNYGGILQNYALQQVLRQLGHDPITLDFISGYSGRHFIMHQYQLLYNCLRGKRRGIFARYARKRKNRTIINFINKHIKLSHTFWNRYSPLLIDQYKIEALIVGSDQVWRPHYVMRIEDMFLEWSTNTDVTRIAYAASFGTADWEFSEHDANVCSYLLKYFDGISVREMSGISHVKRLGSSAELVLDPTLLLGKEGFDKLLDNSDYINHGLGAYILDQNPKLKDIISEIKHVLNLSEYVEFKENTNSVGPIEWINMIRNSSFVVTDSFHGTVFCILYHIPFITYVNINRGADRFYSLLGNLNLTDRILTTLDTNIAQKIAQKPIEWDRIDANIETLRIKSMNFLLRHLN